MAKVTIQTVADEAGVSIKTVSRVINKETTVKASTRDKVLEVIKRLDYEPSLAAQALASNRSKIIGLVYDNPSAAYVMAVQAGVLKACASNYNLVIHPCNHKSEKLSDELLALVQRSNLDGLILTPPIADDDTLIEKLKNASINVVTIAPGKAINGVSSVFCNDEEIVEELISEMIQKGHRDIAMVSGPEDHGAAYQRTEGYKNALKKSGITIQPEYLEYGSFTYESGVEAGKKLLNLTKRPTMIFAANDYMAAGVMSAAHDLNINVPADLSIVGFDDAPVSRQIWPRLTTIKQPVQEMAEAVTKALFEKIANKSFITQHTTHLAEIISRESIATLENGE